jgi:hypothetical protein
MVSALIVVGNAWHFATEARKLKTTLRSIKVAKTKILRGGYAGARAVEKGVSRFLETEDSALLLIYIGHGSTSGWAVDDNETVYNSKLAALLRNSSAPVVLINDTCRAESLILRIQELDPSLGERVLIVAACNAEGTTDETVSTKVMKSWQRGEPFAPPSRRVDVVRFGSGPPLQDDMSILNPAPLEVNVIKTFIAPPFELRWGAELDHHFFRPP